MRKTFNLLFICLIALYGWIGYQVIHTTDLPQCQPEGSLSDVAEEVIAIPLKTNGHCSLNKIKMIKRDREDIFLVSDRQLIISTVPVNFSDKYGNICQERDSQSNWLTMRSILSTTGWS